MNKWINAAGFQAGWWACILGVGHQRELEALAFCLSWIGIQVYVSHTRTQDIRLALLALLLGILIDTALQQLAVIEFYGWALGPLSPFWLWALWLMFALTLNSSLAFLKHQPRITCAALGLVLGPLTYMAGANLGAAAWTPSFVSVAWLCGAWMIAMPLLVSAAQHITPYPKELP